ncbi:MAG: hypothetical protein OXC46_04185 [Thaumarchaeota archaeon]|nr:hypothetical protein [Nitrososphaerota archaeon]
MPFRFYNEKKFVIAIVGVIIAALIIIFVAEYTFLEPSSVLDMVES